MDQIREYLLSVITAALICGVVMAVLDRKGMLGGAVKLLLGIIMLLVVLTPGVRISSMNFLDWADNLSADGTDAATFGKNMAQEAYRAGIIQQMEAYILDEAQTLGCDLDIEITLSDDDLAKPEKIRLSGNVSPYARQLISNMLAQELGIDREDQIWTG